MNRLDLIIDALEESLKDFATDSYGYDYRSCCGADLERGEHGDDCHLLKALTAARELKALESEIDVWSDDLEKMPLNKFCRAWVNWSSYSTDGDSFQHGKAEAIVLKYKRNPDEEDFVFLHRGHKQYLRESFDIIKWQLLDPKPTRKKVTK